MGFMDEVALGQVLTLCRGPKENLNKSVRSSGLRVSSITRRSDNHSVADVMKVVLKYRNWPGQIAGYHNGSQLRLRLQSERPSGSQEPKITY